MAARSPVNKMNPCSGGAAYLLSAVVAVPGLSSRRCLERRLQAARVEGSGAAVTQLQFPNFPADGTVLLMLRLLILFLVFFLLGNQEGRRLTKYGSGGKGWQMGGMHEKRVRDITHKVMLPTFQQTSSESGVLNESRAKVS